MTNIRTSVGLALLLAILVAGTAAAADAPAKALCQVCVAHGETNLEKVAATARHDGVDYYFCATGCRDAFVADPGAYLPPTLPRPAPDFRVATLEGAEATLAESAGQVVLIDFWATWCKPCLEMMPHVQLLHDRYAGAGFAVMGISIDEGEDRREKVSKFLNKHGITYPVYLDKYAEPAWHLYGVKAVPAMFLIDRQGQVVAQWTGTVDEKVVVREVQRVLAQDADGAARPANRRPPMP